MRAESEVKFKSIKHAYEILSDEKKRHLYDTHGMAAFDPSRGGHGGEDVDLNDMNDMFSQLFGMKMGGGSGGGPRRPRRGPDEEQRYPVSLEDLYRGKTVKFQAQKQVICGQCSGSGAKDKVKPNTCDRCQGAGMKDVLRQMGPMLRRETLPCDHCQGSGMYYKEKDRCKKCKGKRTAKETKVLEMYIPRGSVQGEKIVLEGEADQFPDRQPGDIIFVLVEEPHDHFTRIGSDLSTDLDITLGEALGGFSRVVLKHLDGRAIQISHPRGKILRPNEVLKVRGEGMPLKRGEAKGDLYLNVKVAFPEDGWLQGDSSYEALLKLLPPPAPPVQAEEIDEVDYEENADIEEMGAHQGDPRYGTEWEDDDEGDGQPQCATQ